MGGGGGGGGCSISSKTMHILENDREDESKDGVICSYYCEASQEVP